MVSLRFCNSGARRGGLEAGVLAHHQPSGEQPITPSARGLCSAAGVRRVERVLDGRCRVSDVG